MVVVEEHIIEGVSRAPNIRADTGRAGVHDLVLILDQRVIDFHLIADDKRLLREGGRVARSRQPVAS